MNLIELQVLTKKGQVDAVFLAMKLAAHDGQYQVRIKSSLLTHGVGEEFETQIPGLRIEPVAGNTGFTVISWEPNVSKM